MNCSPALAGRRSGLGVIGTLSRSASPHTAIPLPAWSRSGKSVEGVESLAARPVSSRFSRARECW